MKTVVVLCLATALTGCTGSSHAEAHVAGPSARNPMSAASVQAAANSVAKYLHRAVAQLQVKPQLNQGWRFDKRVSPMDGNELIAFKRFSPGSDVQLGVFFECQTETKNLQVKITSIVGNPNNPSRRSAFQTHEDRIAEMMMGGSAPIMRLSGRVRFGPLQPEPLSGMFGVDRHFSNELIADLNGTHLSPQTPMSSNQRLAASIMSTSVDDMTGAAPTENTIYDAYRQVSGLPMEANPTLAGFNPVAALHKLFPIEVQVINGTGTYDMAIPYVQPIEAVLNSCGGRNAIIQRRASQAPLGPTTRAAVPPTASPTKWAVEIGSFSIAGQADKLRDKLRANGFNAFIDPLNTTNSHLWSVRVGPFATRDGGVTARNEIGQRLGIKGFVISQN